MDAVGYAAWLLKPTTDDSAEQVPPPPPPPPAGNDDVGRAEKEAKLAMLDARQPSVEQMDHQSSVPPQGQERDIGDDDNDTDDEDRTVLLFIDNDEEQQRQDGDAKLTEEQDAKGKQNEKMVKTAAAGSNRTHAVKETRSESVHLCVLITCML